MALKAGLMPQVRTRTSLSRVFLSPPRHVRRFFPFRHILGLVEIGAPFPTIMATSITKLHKPQFQGQVSDLITEIGNELDRFTAERNTHSLFEGLLAVDLIERLRISRHFTYQIKTFLETVYREWREETGLGVPEATVLAFRLLRLHGYNVSTGIFQSFKDENGEFSGFSTETLVGISATLNLYRCSQTAFPSESTIMGEAKKFAEIQLRKALQQNDNSNLNIEIEFALDYPRQCLLPRLESRSIVKQLSPGDKSNIKYLQLAKLDMESLQQLYLQEIEELVSWFEEAGFDKLEFARQLVVKSYFTVAAAVYEPKFSIFRVGYTKMGCLASLLDDIYDLQTAKLQDLKQLTDAIKRWEPSLLVGLPQHMITFYNALDNTIVEAAKESSRIQGRDMLPSIRENWEELASVFEREAEWRQCRQIPTFDEYMEVASTSIAGIVVTLSSIFLLGERFSDETLKHIGRGSRFLYLVTCTSRLSNDIVTFKREEERGEVTSAISCYMKDNPNCTQEEALDYLQSFIERALQELELELFKSKASVSECCSRAILNFGRTLNLIYKKLDGYSTHDDQALEHLVKDYLYNPLP